MLYANKNLRLVVAALGLLAAPLSAPAQAAVIFQSALYSGMDTGEYILTSCGAEGIVFTRMLGRRY
jgi:hypothetical protein